MARVVATSDGTKRATRKAPLNHNEWMGPSDGCRTSKASKASRAKARQNCLYRIGTNNYIKGHGTFGIVGEKFKRRSAPSDKARGEDQPTVKVDISQGINGRQVTLREKDDYNPMQKGASSTEENFEPAAPFEAATMGAYQLGLDSSDALIREEVRQALAEPEQERFVWPASNRDQKFGGDDDGGGGNGGGGNRPVSNLAGGGLGMNFGDTLEGRLMGLSQSNVFDQEQLSHEEMKGILVGVKKLQLTLKETISNQERSSQDNGGVDSEILDKRKEVCEKLEVLYPKLLESYVKIEQKAQLAASSSFKASLPSRESGSDAKLDTANDIYGSQSRSDVDRTRVAEVESGARSGRLRFTANLSHELNDNIRSDSNDPNDAWEGFDMGGGTGGQISRRIDTQTDLQNG